MSEKEDPQDDTEVIEGPEPKGTQEAPPSWLTEDADSISATPESKSKTSPEDIQEGAEIFVEGICYLHDMAMEATGYGGFGMSNNPRRIKLWNRSMRFMLKHLKVDKWPEMMALMWLLLDEGLMIVGYFMWRKSHNASVREPPSMKDAPTAPPSVVEEEALHREPKMDALGNRLM